MNKPSKPQPETLAKIQNFANNFAAKSGTILNPVEGVAPVVMDGLAMHIEEVGRPLCPCNFYEDKKAEVEKKTWICACEEMQTFKYCHCLLFTLDSGMPITEYLPEWHEGRQIYGLTNDPTPDKGRALSTVQNIIDNLKEFVTNHKLEISNAEITEFANRTAKRK